MASISGKYPSKEIKKVIKHYGNQTKLANLLGVSQQYIGCWARGANPVPLLFATKIEVMSEGLFKALDLISKQEKNYIYGSDKDGRN